jgi:fanconi-associated nuclease 1
MQSLELLPCVCCAGGMPDLLLWRPSDRRAKLSEVKGPRDRLSEQQRAWAAALSGAGLQVLLPALAAAHGIWPPTGHQ